ncbi:hypothetical protein MO867_12155 [Microbulbifer sp. OS29]|uniref:Thrombospondin type 3 repeat-containing protein n=1 Tax=Microbulbifer okhotskensis TaxID=2926617 RepID=A0A9X2J821_9GAMM|nr:hypothetical protein [Microbulbifer okhotskensis]MCO1335086.1 hypothetical protein [Microbulbifer okhotskensis]
MPDYWESYYGLNINSAEDALFSLDGDGLSNLLEFQLKTNPIREDTDFDGVNDDLDLWPLGWSKSINSDQNGIPAPWELNRGLSDNDAHDATRDDDNDGLTNLQEYQAGTCIDLADNDFDGVSDGEDVAPLNGAYRFDIDEDGLPQAWEEQYQLNIGYDDAGDDLDNDGLTNLQEYQAGTDPHNPDSDGDGVFVGEDTHPADARYSRDEDGDGMADEWEQEHGLYSTDPLDAIFDFDADGLSNLQEYQLGTDPQVADSDRDGINDGEDRHPLDARYRLDQDGDGLPEMWEMQYGLSDSNTEDGLSDWDNDGLTSVLEFELGTNPINPDTGGDDIPDAEDPSPAGEAGSEELAF